MCECFGTVELQFGFGKFKVAVKHFTPLHVWRVGSAPPRQTSRVRGVLYGAKAVRSGVQGGGGSRIFVLRSPPSVPPCHKCSANSGPRAQASFFSPLLSTRYVSGARCVPKRITYTAGAFSIV